MSFYIFQDSCPRCQGDTVHATFFKMRERCGQCGFEYEADSSGAMALNYAFGALIAFPVFFALLMTGASPLVAIGVPAAITAALAPFLVHFSRLAWLHIEFLLHPTKQ